MDQNETNFQTNHRKKANMSSDPRPPMALSNACARSVSGLSPAMAVARLQHGAVRRVGQPYRLAMTNSFNPG
jgi:hypothetical protein